MKIKARALVSAKGLTFYRIIPLSTTTEQQRAASTSGFAQHCTATAGPRFIPRPQKKAASSVEWKRFLWEHRAPVLGFTNE